MCGNQAKRAQGITQDAVHTDCRAQKVLEGLPGTTGHPGARVEGFVSVMDAGLRVQREHICTPERCGLLRRHIYGAQGDGDPAACLGVCGTSVLDVLFLFSRGTVSLHVSIC